MDTRVVAEAFNTSKDRRAGKTFFSHKLHNRLVQGLAVPAIRLSNEDTKERRFTFQFHQIRLPRAKPAPAAMIPATREPAEFTIASA